MFGFELRHHHAGGDSDGVGCAGSGCASGSHAAGPHAELSVVGGDLLRRVAGAGWVCGSRPGRHGAEAAGEAIARASSLMDPTPRVTRCEM